MPRVWRLTGVLIVFVALTICWRRCRSSGDGSSPRGKTTEVGRNAPKAPTTALVPRPAVSAPSFEERPQDPRRRFQQALDAASASSEILPPERVASLIEESLAQTGSSSETWTRDASDTFVALQTSLRDLAGSEEVHVSSARCFAAGCVASVSYPPGTDVRELAQKVVKSPAILAWPGAKMASPEILDDSGGRSNRWLLLRPDDL